MSDAKQILSTKLGQLEKAGSFFIDAFSGNARPVGRAFVRDVARERGHKEVASIVDAEFEEGNDHE
jgi:hypothetical protein